MKNKWLILIILLGGVWSCEDETSGVAVLTTKLPGVITQYTAHSGGNVSSEGESPVTARGTCWSISQSPTTTDSKTTNGAGLGEFNSILTGLLPNTAYYTRAYATNSKGTAYGNELSFTTLPLSGTMLMDIDGNQYDVITIGSQIWMKENLKTTRYRNGDEIPTELSDASWSTTTSGAFAVYNDNPDNNELYGKLYNWFTVTDSRDVAPEGWHVPSVDEWNILTNFLGGDDTAGGAMKEQGLVHWDDPNAGADNSSGFTAMPSGYRDVNGDFTYMGKSSHWWTTEEDFPDDEARAIVLFYDYVQALQVNGSKRIGTGIRCVKD